MVSTMACLTSATMLARPWRINVGQGQDGGGLREKQKALEKVHEVFDVRIPAVLRQELPKEPLGALLERGHGPLRKLIDQWFVGAGTAAGSDKIRSVLADDPIENGVTNWHYGGPGGTTAIGAPSDLFRL